MIGFNPMATRYESYGWCTCRCHMAGSVAASETVSGLDRTMVSVPVPHRLCGSCASDWQDEATYRPFLDYVTMKDHRVKHHTALTEP